MGFWIGLALGLFGGAVIGIVGLSIVASRRILILEHEIMDLRLKLYPWLRAKLPRDIDAMTTAEVLEEADALRRVAH